MRHYFLILSFILLSTGACKRHKLPAEGPVNAKIIDYKVEYLETKAGNIPTSILPSRMTLVFADHFALNRIDGFMGQFSLSYIANLRTSSVTTLLKLFDKRYYYTGKPGELPCGINEMEGLRVEETGNTKNILGFVAKEFISKTDDHTESLIYTADIDNIINPNITTPYRQVDGVLLEFHTSLSIMHMKLYASRIYRKEVDWSIFNIPDNYLQISKEEMETAIKELFR